MQTREALGGIHNGAAPVDPAVVREELERILASPQFRNSKRHSSFLRLVVEETLNGDAGQLKERTVGARVFGLDPGYPRRPTRFRYHTRCASVATSSLDAPRHLACMPDIWASAS